MLTNNFLASCYKASPDVSFNERAQICLKLESSCSLFKVELMTESCFNEALHYSFVIFKIKTFSESALKIFLI